MTVETAQALEHLRRCPECRSCFETQAEWSRLLRRKAGAGAAPEPLRERIAGLVENHQRLPGPRRRWLAAAACLLAGLPAIWLASRVPSRLFIQALCDDHAKYASADSQLRSADTAEIESWFHQKTGFGVRVPALDNAEVLGGRLCFLRGRKAALVFYRKQGRSVSLFELDARDVSLAALERWKVDGAEIRRASSRGYTVAAFEQRGVAYVLVSDLRESELLGLAAAVQIKARGY